MKNCLILQSTNDIPFPEAQISIHQPTINEISLIGEEVFWSGCQFLNFSKKSLDTKDILDLGDMSDFEIFMSIMCDNKAGEVKSYTKIVLTLIFPTSEFKWTPQELILMNKETGISRINSSNYEVFKDILVSMFKLNDLEQDKGYNPIDNRAKKIAEKLKKAKNKKNNGENESVDIDLLGRYVSILAVGEHKDKNELMNYTVSQLKDEFTRFQKKQSFDFYMQAKLAGAQDLEDVDNWMDEIHS